MAWTNITKLNIGEAIKKAFLDAIIDNLTHLFGLAGATTIQAGANGSFENDTDNDGYPDSWVFTPLTNGTGAIDATDSSHGEKSFKFVRTSGGGNGGGTLESDDYFEVTASKRIVAAWMMKSSAAGVRIKVEVRFFTGARTFISAVSIYDNQTTNPTAWTPKTGEADAPSNAYYAKLKITGGDTAPDVAANIWFDEVSITPAGRVNGNMEVFTASGTWNCKVSRALIRVWGSGGGGGGGDTSVGQAGGGGGGGGSYAEAWVECVPGTAYSVTIGTGGSAGAAGGGNGGAGATSSVGSLISAAGGNGGNGASGATNGAGANGGAAGSATFALAGGRGGNGSGSSSAGNVGQGGSGAHAPCGGQGGPASENSSSGHNGAAPGGGGSGGHGSGGAGGAGAAGRVVISW
jgi:hypothetical protein